MTDKAWKPKRLSEGSSETSSKESIVEISVKTQECKSELEKIIAAMLDLGVPPWRDLRDLAPEPLERALKGKTVVHLTSVHTA